ncbi:MAG: hypothetical protein D6756_06700 [Cyanobacteria bacterium J083]|nr:MAG: hypothetical protein D6756_06700 [Cyanobacteria bacterium J083]
MIEPENGANYYFLQTSIFVLRNSKLKEKFRHFFSLALGLAPVISVLLASAVVEIGDCRLHERGVNSYQIWGFELGEILYAMFVVGWFALLSLPLGLLGLIVGLIWLGVKLLKNLGK